MFERSVRRLTLGAAATALLLGLGCSAAAPALAQQQGHFDPNQTPSESATLTTAGGLVSRVSTKLLITEDQSDTANSRVERRTDDGWVWKPALQEPTTLAGAGIVGNNALGAWSYPPAWEHDQQWHPVQEVTIAFSHPVQDPTIDLEGTLTPFRQEGVTGVAVVNQQIRLTGATTADGGEASIGVSASDSGWRQLSTDTYRLINDQATGDAILTPGRVNGEIPYYNVTDFAQCATGPQTSNFPGKDVLLARYSEISLVSGPCASLHVDTRGKAVSSLTYVLDQTYASARTGGTDFRNLSFTGISFTPVVHQELSGHATPGSFGRAAHTVGDLRIGDGLVSARDDVVTDSVAAATATDNSEAGYTPDNQLKRKPLRALSSGEYALTVPIKGASATAYLNGWIDFDGDGSWSDAESATPVKVEPGQETATLRFQLPEGMHVQPDGVTARLRLAYDRVDVESPVGLAASGEVEDHSFVIEAATPTGGLTVDKKVTTITRPDGTTTDVAQAGDKISYSIVVTDDSPFAIKDIAVKDPLLGGTMSCVYQDGQDAVAPMKLAAGEHFTCTGSYTVTKGDVAAGSVHNVATATGTWDDPDLAPDPVPSASDEVDTDTTDGTDPPGPTPSDGDDDLAFTGAAVTGVALLGIAMLTAGVTLLIRRRGLNRP